jgi:hypothetical protein
MRSSFVALALVAVVASVGASDEMEGLYNEFNSATNEILEQLHTAQEAEATPVKQSEEEELAQLDPDTEGPMTQMLLDEKAHKAAVKASYQSNVKTIYFHLEEIIKKILAHKQKWTAKYNGDLGKIAKEVLKHKNNAKAAEKKYVEAKGKASAAKKLSDLKNKSWQKAKNKLKQKINDAKKAKGLLKALYLKGLKQKAGEICMIRKIQCMVAKFNGEAKLQQKYCGVCSDDKKAKMIQKWVDSAGKPAPAAKPQKLKATSVQQSSTGWNGPASRAVDGNTNTNYNGNSCTHTYNKPNEWWKMKWGSSKLVRRVEVWNRSDCCNGRLAGATVFVGNTKIGTLSGSKGKQNINTNRVGNQLLIKNKPGQYLTLCEVKVFG